MGKKLVVHYLLDVLPLKVVFEPFDRGREINPKGMTCKSLQNIVSFFLTPTTSTDHQAVKKRPKPNANYRSNHALVLIFEPPMLYFVVEYKLICAFSSADFKSVCLLVVE